MNTKKKIIICGKSASGKTEFLNICRPHLCASISHTTRPPRLYEHDGIDYFFVDDMTFDFFVEKNLFIEHTIFRDWKYGLTLCRFMASNIFIMTPSGISTILNKFPRTMFYIVLIDTLKETRISRSLKRGDCMSEIERRIITDDFDFSMFSDYDTTIHFDDSTSFDDMNSIAMDMIELWENNKL